MRRRALLAMSANQNERIPNNMIVYKTDDESIIEPYFHESFGANLVSNTYIDGKGQMVFDGDITHIGAGAFQEISNITSIQIPNSVTSIGDFAFYCCLALTNFKVPDSVTSIGESAFDFCIELTSITLGNSLSHIDSYAFYDCDGLITITIPESVTLIGNGVFEECTMLESVYVKATVPPTLYPFVFLYNDSNRKIYVPRASVDTYKTTDSWSEYASAIEPYDF